VTALDPCLEKLQRSLRSALDAASGSDLSWHPPGKWSTAEIFEHLYRTYTGTIKGFERVVAAGKSLATPISWKQRAMILLVVKLGYLPSGRKAPKAAQPVGVAQEQVSADLLPAISRMEELISRCEQQFGANKKLLDHPLLGPLSGQEWRKFHLVHGLHHMRQIRTLRDKKRRTEVGS
jgi:hypothetical protein